MARAVAKPSLADAIAAAHTPRIRCTVALLSQQLDDDQRADLHAAITNTAIPAPAISKGLETLGHDLAALSIQRHRRHECNCPR